MIINNNTELTFQSTIDWNALTVIILYSTVSLILQSRIKSHGIKPLYEAINVKELISELKKNATVTIEKIREVSTLNDDLYYFISELHYQEKTYDLKTYNLESLKYNICNYSKSTLQNDYLMYEMNGTTYIGIDQALSFKVSNTALTIESKDGNFKIQEDVFTINKTLQAIHKRCDNQNINFFGYVNYNLAKYLYLELQSEQEKELLYFFVPSIEVKIHNNHMVIRYLESNPFSELDKVYEDVTLKNSPLPNDTEQSLINQKCDMYKNNVIKAVEDIKNNMYSKVILSRRIVISDRIHMIRSYFLGLRVNNPARSYLFDINSMKLFGFSPETIVQVDNDNKVLTFPLAGTRKNQAHLKKELLTDIKEVGEHAVSVKLAIDELKEVCQKDTVKVDEFMHIYERGSVQHLGSRVSGILKNNNYWNALLSLYPAVTASGIPRKESVQAIEKYEDEERDLYSGGVFLIHQDIGFDVALILRSIFQNENETHAQVGAGIVEKSKPDREFEETCEKLSSVLQSLSM